MGLLANFMKIFKLAPIDLPKTKPFPIELVNAVERAEKARKLLLHSNLSEKDRLKLTDEILQTMKLIEEETIWEMSQSTGPWHGLF